MFRISRIELPTPFYVGPVNVWILRGDACVLVDAGIRTPEGRAAFLEGLRKAKVELRDIQAVLLTHGHPDHFGLAREIREAGARIHVHAGDRELVEGYPGTHRRILEKFGEIALLHGFPAEGFRDAAGEYRAGGDAAEPACVDREVADGDMFEFGSIRLRAIHTPGHSSGSTCFQADGRLFCGDTVLERVTPVTFFRGHRSRMGPGEFSRSIARLKTLDVRTAHPGHGAKFADFAGAVRRIERHLELRSARILQSLDRPKTAWELSAAAFPTERAAQQWVSFAETLGHLEELEVEGRVRRVEERPVRFERV